MNQIFLENFSTFAAAKLAKMIYPKNFEAKIGFSDVRKALKGRCLSSLGVELVDKIQFLTNAKDINEKLQQVKEFRCILQEEEDFPEENFLDMRASLVRIQTPGTYMDESELFALKLSLSTIDDIVRFLNPTNENSDDTSEESEILYPALHRLTQDIAIFPLIIQRINSILNKFGKIKDDASPELFSIRRQISETKRGITSSLRSILTSAQQNGYAPADASPTLREGRLVIPIFPSLKRRISGIVHTESATGKTLFLEPQEVVEANNRIRSLEADEQRAIIVILQEISELIRPQVHAILNSYGFLGMIDVIRAKSLYADYIQAHDIEISPLPTLDWHKTFHPLLQEALTKHGKSMIPLDIRLNSDDRILLISGPNAGGKSVSLKTTGLLQYMVQCGLPIPVEEGSKIGLFSDILLDMGDEQSIEDELSTYSGHLSNMKVMLRTANEKSLVLIDEMGSGTEPQMGAAIAQAILHGLLEKKTWGIITTHYQNLKDFAQKQKGIVNGAMLYDRQQMLPLFKLQIGMPGSSFAIEIARKTGLPQSVIEEASQIVGSDYIQSDKYLQDIMRDKHYWENKRQQVHERQKHLDELVDRYEKELGDISSQRKAVIREAKEKAEFILRESNAKVENTIRAIRQSQAEKEETQRARQSLNEYKQDMAEETTSEGEDLIAKKMEQIRQRRIRHEQRKQQRLNGTVKTATSLSATATTTLSVNKQKSGDWEEGDFVQIDGGPTCGKIEKIKGNNAVIVLGNIRITVKKDRLTQGNRPKEETAQPKPFLTRATQNQIQTHTLNFTPNLDVRGYSGDEAIQAVAYFMEDAIMTGSTPLRILHGTGTGYLRQVIRQFLKGHPHVASAHDEHVQLGGSGITVVEMDY